MKSIRNLCLVGALAAIAACDPYTAENKGKPEVISAFASNGGDFSEGSVANDQWAISSSSVCTGEHLAARGVVPRGKTVLASTIADIPVIYVKTNKLLDGSSIQADPVSCEPAKPNGTSWLTVKRVVGTVETDDSANWFSCYNPSSPTSSEGASIILYRGADVSTGVEGEGWFAVSEVEGEADQVATYKITGDAFDKQGNALPVKVAFAVEPDAGSVKSFRATELIGTGDAVTATLAFTQADCASASSYQVQKSTGTDADGNTIWANVGGAIPAAGPFTVQDTGLTYGKSYSYRVRATVAPAGSAETFTETAATYDLTVLEFPGVPTVSLLAASGTGTSAKPNRVSVDYTGALPAGVASYAVLRAAEDESIAADDQPGAFSVIAPDVGLAGSTATATFPFEDTKLSGCQLYFYAVASVDAAGLVGEHGPAATIKSPPAKVAAPTLAAETAGGVKVTWTILRGAVTYQVQRAADNAGTPGTFADVGSPVAQPVNDPVDATKPATKASITDATAAAGTKYYYRVNIATSDPALCSDTIATSTGASASITR